MSLIWLQVGEYERMTKDTSRSAYTRRIMEIVANIQKQKEEINKVEEMTLFLILSLFSFFQILTDTRYVQKEINQLSGKLDRTFKVTDEQIYKVSNVLVTTHQTIVIIFAFIYFYRM